MTVALHILTIRNGEVFLHHVWQLFFLACGVFGCAASSHRSGK